MSATGSDLWPAVSATAYDLGAERLMSAVRAASGRTTDFPAQVEAGLGAALAFLAADPDLARLLVPRPYGGGTEALRSHRRWRERYAELLRHAAEKAPEAATHPPFLEPTLSGGICFQIARFLLDDRAEQLQDLLPDLREFLLVYYLGPGESARL
jgi:hypothetical protein